MWASTSMETKGPVYYGAMTRESTRDPCSIENDEMGRRFEPADGVTHSYSGSAEFMRASLMYIIGTHPTKISSKLQKSRILR